MKRFYWRLAVLILLIFFVTNTSRAQRSNGLAVEGKITVEEGSVEGAVIQMFQDGRRLDNYGVGADGNYKVELNYNHKFELIFTLDGNFPQKIMVDTNVPQRVLQSDPKFPPFPVDVNLFTEIPGIDRTFSQNTIMKLYYSQQVDNFISERYYNDAQIKNLIDQAILQSQIIDKESDYLSRLTKAELAELRKEYDQLLSEAEKEYSNEQFLDALDGYKAANMIFPKEQYPKDRITEINDLLGLMMVAEDMQKALAERFDKLIENADQLFSMQKYFESRNSYNRALSIKPDNYAKQQVDKINDIIKNQKNEQEYQDIIIRGNNAFNEMLYEESLRIFTDASTMRPEEQYPKQKIAEITKILDELAKNTENQKSYEQAIFQAELNFEKQFYDKSLASYQNALIYKPGDIKATARIKEIQDLMSMLANKTLYDKLIASADKAYKKEQYKVAIADYEKALELFPDETYPAQRISLINGVLNEEANFLAAIEQADQAFGQKQYERSKSFYSKALEIRAKDKYAQERIDQIDDILASMDIDEQYNNLIVEADNRFERNQLEEAKNIYNQALAVKSAEGYPKDKIAEINSILQEIARNNQNYQQTIVRADGLFAKENFEDAKNVYAEAGNLKPTESYPKEMINKIDSLLLEQARLLAEKQAAEKARLEAVANERDRNYQNTIDEADRLLSENELVAAVGKFRAALEIKPQEQYPITRIEQIRGMISIRQEAEKNYEAAIAKADREFQRESFDEAIIAYNQAKQAKSEETYPDEMLVKIDSIIQAREQLAAEAAAAEAARLAAIEAEKDSLYNAAITGADNLFNAGEYENARTAYRSASTIKSDETYPQQRIDEIGNLLAQLSASQKTYEDAIAKADREFQLESFDEAIIAYNQAKQAKSEETYPDEMLVKIDSIIQAREQLAAEAAAAEAVRLAAIEAEKDSLYIAAIAGADNLFNAGEYENARTAYRSASTIKSEETYPQQRIDEIGNLLAQLSASQKAYEDAIAKADREFQLESFDEAIIAYNQAKQAKSEETYPDEMLVKIDSIIQAREQLAAEAAAAEAARLAAIEAEKDSLYKATITDADNLFNSENYENARTAYRSASTIKSEETYPQQRILEIENIIRQQQLAQKEMEIRNKNYEDAIALADKYYSNKNYAEAKSGYQKAIGIKPQETYPKDKILLVDSLINQQELDEKYREIILAADGYFRTETYEDAKTEYQNALQIKPNEQYPVNQIAKIDAIAQKEQQRILGEQQAAADLERRRMEIAQQESAINEQEMLSEAGINSIYNEYIAQADNYFSNKQYNISRGWYYKAWDLKPEETYPPQRINEINRLVGGMLSSQRDRDYQGFIDLADSTFRENQLAVARGWYNRALSIKTNESYPKNQLNEIQRLITERLAGQSGQLFESHVEKAVKAFGDKDYNVARFWYKKALELRPNDPDVKNKLQEITDVLK